MTLAFETEPGLPLHRLRERSNGGLAAGLAAGGFFDEDAFDSLSDSNMETVSGDPRLASDSGSEPSPATAEDMIASACGRWGYPYAKALTRLNRRFALQSLLGRGGMGEVYRAHDQQTGRDVALKLGLGEMNQVRLERFRREGEITASLDHPGIVRIHTAGDMDGIPYLVYELVEGCRTLKEVFREVPLRRRIELIRDAARALGYAHERGVIHRDVKPPNLLVDARGRLRVADFGLAAARSLAPITQAQTLLGTPYYMAPEQVLCYREALGPETDVWALGVILYQALTDTLPFEADSLHALRCAIALAKPAPPDELSGDLDPALVCVCMEALSRDPVDRHANGDALADDLDAILSGVAPGESFRRTWRRWRPRKVHFLGALGACLPLLLGAAFGASRTELPPPVVDTAAPFVQVAQPIARSSETLAASICVRGRVRDGSPWVDVVIGEQRVRVASTEAFDVEVPLRIGWNRVRVDAIDAAGNRSAGRHLLVHRLNAPTWFEDQDSATRPPLPLPEGLVFGSEPGDYVNVRDGSVLVWVPAATFTRGGRGEDDVATGLKAGPSHRVRLTQGVFVGKHEVTWGQFRRYCRARGVKAHKPRYEVSDAHPVHAITFERARGYCAWAGLRLPTEAEWELAAAGPDGRRMPWGAPRPSDAVTHFNGEGTRDGYERTAPVGSYPEGTSPSGCLDMAGNVMEWVSDWFGEYEGAGDVIVDPRGPQTGTRRVIRGGGWKSTVWFSRTTYRDSCRPAARNAAVGFRVALSGSEGD